MDFCDERRAWHLPTARLLRWSPPPFLRQPPTSPHWLRLPEGEGRWGGRAHFSLAQGEFFMARTRGAAGLDAEKQEKTKNSQQECQSFAALGNLSPALHWPQAALAQPDGPFHPVAFSRTAPTLLPTRMTLHILQAELSCPLPPTGLGFLPGSFNTLCSSLLSVS